MPKSIDMKQPLTKVWEKCRSYFSVNELFDGTNSPTSAESARLAADLGLQPGDLSTLNSSRANFEGILNLRLQQLRILPETVSASALWQMQLQCIRCVHKDVCDREAKRGILATWPADCPNLKFFQTLVLHRNYSSAHDQALPN